MKKSNQLLINLGIALSAALGTHANAAVEGYVDMHSHLMAEHAFGGSWLILHFNTHNRWHDMLNQRGKALGRVNGCNDALCKGGR